MCCVCDVGHACVPSVTVSYSMNFEFSDDFSFFSLELGVDLVREFFGEVVDFFFGAFFEGFFFNGRFALLAAYLFRRGWESGSH